MSWSSVGEGELALIKHNISKKVSYDEMYEPGHHHTGPSYDFERVNAKIHTTVVHQSSSWTCPLTESGVCNTNTTSSDTNNIGQTIYTTFSIQYNVIGDLENLQLAYESYQFDDSLVEEAVRRAAVENSKETPQSYTLEEILAEDETQIVIDEDNLNDDLNKFGYELYDVIVTEIQLSDSAANKYLKTEMQRYQDR
eukprot:UN29027